MRVQSEKGGRADGLSIWNTAEPLGFKASFGMPAKIIRLYQAVIHHNAGCRQAGKGSHFETQIVARDVMSYAT